MNQSKAILSGLLVLLALSFGITQNDFDYSIGLKMGSPKGLVFKKHRSGVQYFQYSLGFRSDKGDYFITSLSSDYLRHLHFYDMPKNFDFYYGGGLSLDFWKFYRREYNNYSSVSTGLKAILGISYEIEKIPIILTSELTPTYRIYGMGAGLDCSFFSVGCSLVIR